MSSLVASAEYILAIVKEKNDDGQMEYTVYFINNADKPIESMQISTGSFVTADVELVQSEVAEEEGYSLVAKDFMIVEYLDDYDFDFVNWYQSEFQVEGEAKKLHFEINKYRQGLIKVNAMSSITRIPVIDKAGEVALP